MTKDVAHSFIVDFVTKAGHGSNYSYLSPGVILLLDPDNQVFRFPFSPWPAYPLSVVPRSLRYRVFSVCGPFTGLPLRCLLVIPRLWRLPSFGARYLRGLHSLLVFAVPFRYGVVITVPPCRRCLVPSLGVFYRPVWEPGLQSRSQYRGQTKF